MWKNQTQPQQPLLLMLVTSLLTLCCGMSSHSSTSICPRSANMVVLVTLERTAGPSWSQNGVQWGWGQDCRQAILSTPTLLVQQAAKRSPCLLHTVTLRSMCRRQNLDSSLNIMFLHMLRFLFKWAWRCRAVMADLLAAVRDRRVAAVWHWQRRFVTFFKGASHILSSAAHPTNACSSQM